MITETQLVELTKNNGAGEWLPYLYSALKHHNIWSKPRTCAFLAQTIHESAGFTILSENLNYSQQGLRKVFPKYFPDDNIAFRYARQPQSIANLVYAGRMGNGSEASGDGFKYRGRGIIQITGKTNYSDCSKFLFNDSRLIDSPDMLIQKEYAILSACWFWVKNNLNTYADKGDFVGLTKRINGGTIGLPHREEVFSQAMGMFTDEDFNV